MPTQESLTLQEMKRAIRAETATVNPELFRRVFYLFIFFFYNFVNRVRQYVLKEGENFTMLSMFRS